MEVFTNEYVVAFDIDDTLLMWTDNHNQPYEGSVEILDPYDNKKVYLTPNQKHIDLLRRYHGRGMCVMVWSAGGVLWAQAAIHALGLKDFVTLVITKPSKYVDDLQAAEILGQRIYLK